MSALRDLAVTIRKLNNQSPEVRDLQSAKTFLQHLKQRSIVALAEDDAAGASSARYRTGGSDTPPNECLVYLRMTAPDPDQYLFALPTGLDATIVVNALNALPPA